MDVRHAIDYKPREMKEHPSMDRLDREGADEILVRLSFLNPGWSTGRIHREFVMLTGLDVSEATIRKRLSEYRERYEEMAPERIEQLRLMEVRRLDHLEQEAWRAWGKMLGGAEELTEYYDVVEGERVLKKVQRRVNSKVDATFLNTIQRIQESRQKLLGLASTSAIESAVAAINENDNLKVYVGVSPDEWDDDDKRVIEGKIVDESRRDEAGDDKAEGNREAG